MIKLMKIGKSLLTLLFLLFSITFSYAQKLKINANPINIASQLILDTDSANMASNLEYYGYSFQSSENGKTVYQHPDGTVITYSFPYTDTKIRYPEVLVKSKVSEKEIKKILENMSYKKIGSHYEHNASKYGSHITKCTPTHNSTLKFQRIKK